MERYNYEQDESYIQRLREYIEKLEEENKKLKQMNDVYVPKALRLEDENKKLKIKIKKWKNIREIISDCVMLSFFCFMCSWCLCMLFQMITDVIMWFQFIRFA